jgi:hypothetical protein
MISTSDKGANFGRNLFVVEIEALGYVLGSIRSRCAINEIGTSCHVGCVVWCSFESPCSLGSFAHALSAAAVVLGACLDQRYSEVLGTLLTKPTKSHFAGGHPIVASNIREDRLATAP